MNLLPDDFILLDVEYTSWEGAMARNWSNPGEHREIVQIAAIKIENRTDLKIVDQFSTLSKTLKNPILSDYFTKLTGITQLDLHQDGIAFPDAFAKLFQFATPQVRPIYTWGDGDETALNETCVIHQIDFRRYFQQPFIDIRPVFAELGVETKNYQSGTVYKSVGATLSGKQHNALFDVLSMFEALRKLTTE